MFVSLPSGLISASLMCRLCEFWCTPGLPAQAQVINAVAYRHEPVDEPDPGLIANCRPVREENGDLLRFTLGSGDVLIMRGTLQQHWAHSVPPCSRNMSRRLNLTFRNVTKPMKQKA